MAWIVVAAIIGGLAGWFLRGIGAPKRRDVQDLDDRLRRSERRIRSVATERDNEHSEVLTLRAALRSERQLLDSVAGQNNVDPEAFRKTVSREYLGRELVVSPSSLVDTRFRTGDTAPAGAEHDRIAELEAELADRDTKLAEARDQIHRIRADVEVLAAARQAERTPSSGVEPSGAEPSGVEPSGVEPGHDLTGADGSAAMPSAVLAVSSNIAGTAAAGAPESPSPQEGRGGKSADPTIDLRADPTVIDLCESSPADGQTTVPVEHLAYLEGRAKSVQALEAEVATLRERLADLTVEHDEIRSRIGYRRRFDARLEALVDELEGVRVRLVAEHDDPESEIPEFDGPDSANGDHAPGHEPVQSDQR